MSGNTISAPTDEKNLRDFCYNTGMKQFASLVLLLVLSCGAAERRLPLAEYREKMAAGWLGQMVGVAVGYPTEFKFNGPIVPQSKLARLCGPEGWVMPSVNEAYGQDDLYVEMTFLRTLEQYGLDVGICQAGIDFANSAYPLWCANDAGRKNLRKGIAPPDSSHPAFTSRCNDIDYQIEADFSGLISPGLPQRAIKLGETFGRLMNYGDGLYAGQFVGALYAGAFFATNRVELVREALRAIPAESQYAAMVRDTLARYETFARGGQGLKAGEAAWEFAQRQAVRLYFDKSTSVLKDSNGGIDARLNGAMVLIGFLYGEGDPAKTIEIATRCGFDSDCNPSTAAGILFTMLGQRRLDRKWGMMLEQGPRFHSTPYTFQALVNVCLKLAEQVVVAEGGRVDCDPFGNEVFVIPVQEPRPSAFHPSWDPDQPTGRRFSAEEQAKILFMENGKRK